MAGTGFYYLHPLLAGPIEEWREHLDRIAAMGFGAVIIAPPFRPGASGDLFLTADHDRLDPRLGTGDAVEALARWAQAAVSRGLRAIMDLVVDRVAAEATGNDASTWYRSDADDEPPDPRRAPQEPGVARLQADGDIDGLVAAWSERLAIWADAGIVGFRCLRPHRVPPVLAPRDRRDQETPGRRRFYRVDAWPR
jgi:starch synthase (maltosyl-transferring)